MNKIQIEEITETTHTIEYDQLKPFTLESYGKLKPYYLKYTSQVHDLNLTNLSIWYKKHNLHYLELGGYLWFVYHPENQTQMMISEPVGDYLDHLALSHATKMLFEYMHEHRFMLAFRHVSEAFKLFLTDFVDSFETTVDQKVQEIHEIQDTLKSTKNLELYTNEDDYDYIYLVENLANLSGNKFHKKKNHLNQFFKNYETRYAIAPINASNANDALTAARNWCIANGCGETYDLCHEYNGIYRILTNWEAYSQNGLVGVVIYLDAAPVALTFGELIQNDTFLVHIEKAAADVMGAYTAINHALANLIKDRCIYVNREQDMGIEGIKKAKQSYHPIERIAKYDIKVFL